MRRIIRACVAVVLVISLCPLGFPQLRQISPYSDDRIHADQTFFVLKDANTAVFSWASEWTQGTVQDYADKHAFFVWHFKDGSKSYSRHPGYFGDLGKSLDYLVCNESGSLENEKLGKIQPMTLSNYPVKVELWLGEEQNGFKLETRVDAACFEGSSLEYGRTYYFSKCKE